MRKFNLPRTIWWDDGSVRMIDQTKLPCELDILKITDHRTMGRCIREMNVRGAPAIGAAAAYGMALASLEYRGSDVEGLQAFLGAAANYLKGTRPTAVNLSWAVDRVLGGPTKGGVEEMRRGVVAEAKRIAEEDEEVNRRIGRVGSDLIHDGYTVETHCNAGSLATVYYGTALAPVYRSWEEGKSLHVIVDETRPRLQGARLTAWELSYVGIPHTIITDSMAAPLMRWRGVDVVMVGADRIAMNGDVANKIGTYALAIVAKEHRVPLYVAAPTSTIDPRSKTGGDIPIEERSPDEVLRIGGRRLAPEGSRAWNPAFDITPAHLITAIITEKGIVEPREEEITETL